MREVPQKMTDAWKAPDKTGARRPVVRATVAIQNQRRFEYDTAWATGGSFEPDKHRKGVFTSMLFGDITRPQEIRNIIQYSWSRSVEQDVATCEMTILNSELTPMGEPDAMSDMNDLDEPGIFTHNRGDGTEANRWGFDSDKGWNGVFVPDRVVKTYEGYGCDMNVMPMNDTNLVQSGTWLIETVTQNDDGTITLSMKDFGKLLLDQIVFPPVIPKSEYPLSWSVIQSENVEGRDARGGDWTDEKELARKGRAHSSNNYYIGKGLVDPPYPHYVSATGGWNGHNARQALINLEGKWWTSTGQTTRDSKVWWQYDLDDPMAVAQMRVHLAYGPYRVYVSIHNGDKWLGKREIPYSVTTENVDVEAGIPYVQAVIGDRKAPFDIVFKKVYKNVKKIRLTFSHLYDHGGGYPYRASLRDVRLYTGPANSLHFAKGEYMKVVGNYIDYTDIVKWVCAWGGFFWPPHSTGHDFVRMGQYADYGVGDDHPDRVFFTYSKQDGVLPKGRVWGDFMQSGTAGVADLSVDMFDKKPLMDVINYVRDLLGFLFFIDETGGVVWRMPNIWALGNYLSPSQFGERTRNRSTEIITLDDEETLLSYSTILSSQNLRDRIFVGNATGGIGTVIKGFNPYPVGMRRMAGWTDQNFKTKREARVMADMISARQMFTYKRGKAEIPGYPAIQIDDQIRIYERTTNETYYHYVMGISCTLNMEEGDFTYQLDTHWLGEDPNDAWVVKVEELPGPTRQYLNAVGYKN